MWRRIGTLHPFETAATATSKQSLKSIELTLCLASFGRVLHRTSVIALQERVTSVLYTGAQPPCPPSLPICHLAKAYYPSGYYLCEYRTHKLKIRLTS